jgi:hypothetical protein
VTFAALPGLPSLHDCDVSIIRVDRVVAESQADKHGRHKCCVLTEVKQVVRVLAVVF